MNVQRVETDVVIFGGGCAGLWLLDALVRQGYRTLLIEARALGSGQTVGSQGIIHGGLKYTLDGVLSSSAAAIREMPLLWRDCLAGKREPALTRTVVRSPCCYLWRTRTVRSRLGMVGARVGLRVKPVKLDRSDWPAALQGCPGEVYRLDEQVIDPASLLADLAARHRERLLGCDPEGVEFLDSGSSASPAIGLTRYEPGPERLELRPRFIVLCAGEGNEALRRRLGLPGQAMQRRPLHMAMVRGELPELYGHCTDGARTRVTITSAQDAQGRRVWLLGGQVAEDGVGMSPEELVRHARREVAAVLPGVPLEGTAWATYRVDRAEEATPGGRRPADVGCRRDGAVITAWPTKLALAPRLAERVRACLPPPARPEAEQELPEWPRPEVAPPPWDWVERWYEGV